MPAKFFTYSAHQATYENLLKTRLILEIKFDLEIEIFKVKGAYGNFFTIFYAFSASNYVRKPSQNSAYTRNEIWPWNRDFQGQECLCLNFFYIRRVKLRRNTLSSLHNKWDKFFTLHFTLPAGLVDISTSSQVGYSTWDIQWFYV